MSILAFLLNAKILGVDGKPPSGFSESKPKAISSARPKAKLPWVAFDLPLRVD